MRLLLALSLIFATSLARAADKVTIATLNCHFLSKKKLHVRFGVPLFFKDWNEDQKATWAAAGYRDAQYQKTVKAVAAAIKRIDADVMVLTEVAYVPKTNSVFATPNDLTALHDELRGAYPHMAFGDSSDTVTHQNVAILSKRPLQAIHHKIPGREGYYKELDDPESEDEATISKGMSAVVKVDGRPVRIYAVHLKSERGGHESDAQRMAQASIVRRNYLKDLAGQGLVIVAGDLNDHRGQPTLRRIRGFDDLGEDLVQTGGPVFFPKRSKESFADFNKRLRNHWTFEFSGKRNQVDHILISQSIRNLCTQRNHHKRIQIEFIDITEKLEGTSQLATDHRAIKLTLEFLDKHL